MDRKKAIALSFSVPVAWGFSYPLMKIGMDSMNATSIVALRCIIAFAACLLLFHKRAFRINRDLMVRAAIIGAIMATELTCMCLGSSLTSASTAGFLQSLTVVIVPFANAALLRRAPERKVLVGTAIVTCGMLLLSGADFTSLNPGALIMLLSAFIYASFRSKALHGVLVVGCGLPVVRHSLCLLRHGAFHDLDGHRHLLAGDAVGLGIGIKSRLY